MASTNKTRYHWGSKYSFTNYEKERKRRKHKDHKLYHQTNYFNSLKRTEIQETGLRITEDYISLKIIQ